MSFRRSAESGLKSESDKRNENRSEIKSTTEDKFHKSPVFLYQIQIYFSRLLMKSIKQSMSVFRQSRNQHKIPVYENTGGSCEKWDFSHRKLCFLGINARI